LRFGLLRLAAKIRWHFIRFGVAHNPARYGAWRAYNLQ